MVVKKTCSCPQLEKRGVGEDALPGTVGSLPVVAENRKEVVRRPTRVQHDYDENFLYERLLYAANLHNKK